MKNLNIKLMGDGFVTEGVYNNIKIMGNSKSIGNIKANEVNILGDANFNGNLDFEILKVSGDSNIEGNLECNKFKIMGNAYINGNLDCKELKVIGSLIVNGACKIDRLIVTGEVESNYDIECNNVMIKGSLKCKQSITSKYIKSYGELIVEKNIESEIVNVDGSIDCKGLLNAEEVIITPRGRCRCNEIGASIVEVTSKPNGVFKPGFLFGKMSTLSCNLIEGDHISLEKSKVKNIRGKEVKLINKCEVDNIEYNEILEVSSNSDVKNSIKA